MKKRIYAALGVVWFLAFVFLILLLVNNNENNKLISNYYSGNYKLNKYDGLGFTQPYIAPFNRGDVYYQKGEYELARAEYQKALSKKPPKTVECKIRVNLALTEIEFLNLEDIDYDDVDGIIESLREIQKILTLKGCANEDLETGHDENAQQLYNDIENFIEQLEKEKEEAQNQPNQQDPQNQDPNQDNQNGQSGQNGGQDSQNGGQDGQNGGQDNQNGGQDGQDGGQDQQNGGQDGQNGQDGGQDQQNGGQGNQNDLTNHDDPQGGQGNQNDLNNHDNPQGGQGGSQDPVEQYFNDIMNQGTGERLDELGDASTWYNYSYTEIFW